MPSTGRCPNFAPPFKRLLEEVGILADPKTGLDRVPYSMRHYYATRAIVRGITYERLEKQMGTSADMLRTHYDHADVMAHADELSGYGEAQERERMEALTRRAVAREARRGRGDDQSVLRFGPAEWGGDYPADAREQEEPESADAPD